MTDAVDRATEVLNLTDVTRQPHPNPCPDCGREHMNGEHISLTVPASDGGTRTVWEGCADCWAKRTDPKNVTTEARDAAVAAKALRDAADGMVLRHVTSSPEIDPLDYDTSLDYAEALAETYLYVQADHFEREGGRDA